MVENIVLRIFELKRIEVTEGWRKLYNVKLRNLYSPPSLIRIVIEDEMGRECSTEGHIGNWWENQDIGGLIIIKWILEIGVGWYGLD
jgi:hypothetical protein